jgi:hypothetical protein
VIVGKHARTSAALTALVLCAPTGLAQEPATLRWKGRAFDLAASAGELPQAAVGAARFWAAWAEASGYRMDLASSGSLLLLTPAASGRASSVLKLAERAEALLDAELPEPPRSAPAGAQPENEEWSWGATDAPLGLETVVLVDLNQVDDLPGVLAFLARSFPHLASWAQSAGDISGFTIEGPPCGAFVQRDPKSKEWKRENEIVHRAAQLLLLRRFGVQPTWLAQGYAWHVELELQRSVYCFPHRAGFVKATEHKGWDALLRARFAQRAEQALAMTEFADWRAGTYDDERGKVSWGLVELVLRHDPPALALVLEDLRAIRARESRIEHGDGSWTLDTAYTVPLEEQAEVLRARVAPTVLADAARAFAKGSSFAPHWN